MRIAKLIRFAGRMQWIREEQQSIALESVRGQHRRRSSSHGSSADYQLLRLDLLAHPRDDGGDALLEARHRIGAAGFFLLVQEVEADDVESAGAESVGSLDDSSIVHVAARAVGAHEGDAMLVGLGRLVDCRRLLHADLNSPTFAIRLDRRVAAHVLISRD